MKAMQTLKLVLIALFLCSSLIGCAKSTPQMDQEDVGKSDMSQPSEVKGADEGSMKAEVVPTHDDIAGMERINFDFDQFTLSAEARSILGNNAKYLQANSGTNVVIEGHCDERGSDEYNLALGESRALAAKNYLVSLGISAKRLSVISYGEEKPLSKGTGESVWAQNRRAEFKAIK
ncbi:MAG: peptidoglycan-associated lipoprotein Pal [Deltaproteobacteria bacterium]|nr:MAG: peptidoglycan-associated lipoprotein Pal [Deltaproteobacteria bacterium]